MYWDDGAELPQPPRKLPHLIGFNLRFGNPFSIIGWGFLCIGLMVGFVFARPVDVYESLRLSTEGQPINAIVTDVDESIWTSDGKAVFIHTYEFMMNDKTYKGTSEIAGSAEDVGAKIEVTFLPTNPKISKMKGSQSAFGSLFVIIFPIIGLCFVVFSYRRGSRWVHLLRNGIETSGRVIATEPTGVRVNDEPQYKVTLSFTDVHGVAHQTEFKTMQVEELTDEPEETLLYDSNDPTRALPVDGLPDSVRLTRDGILTSTVSIGLLLSLVGMAGTAMSLLLGSAIMLLIALL